MTKAKIYDPAKEEIIPVTLTKAAITHIRKEIKKRGKGIGLRFGVKPSGCSGWMYVLDIADDHQQEDYVFPVDKDLKVIVDPKSYAFVKGTTLDYVKKGLNEVFVFNNPNEENSCGCGESFTVNK